MQTADCDQINQYYPQITKNLTCALAQFYSEMYPIFRLNGNMENIESDSRTPLQRSGSGTPRCFPFYPTKEQSAFYVDHH